MPRMKQQVIPSVRHAGAFMEAASTGAEMIVLSQSNMDELVKVKKICRRSPHLQLLVHMDMIKGLSHTGEGVLFLQGYLKPHGIISSHPQVMQAAKEMELLAIQRCFVFDENSLELSIRLAAKGGADYLQVLPGIVPKTIRRMKQETGMPVIGGGLIRTREEVEAAVSAGAEAVTTSAAALWQQAAARGINRS